MSAAADVVAASTVPRGFDCGYTFPRRRMHTSPVNQQRDLLAIALDPKMHAVLRSYWPFFHTLAMELANKVMSPRPH
jgi:hypothetical protein